MEKEINLKKIFNGKQLNTMQRILKNIGINRKEKMKYLKIKTKDIKRYIGYYEDWYNTFDKDGYKYVIEQLNFDDKYYNDLLSSLHNFVKGGKFYKIKK
jgi:hypothetical protein